MQDPSLELRVLNGLQSGAHLSLPPGQYLIGTSADCDIILRGLKVAPQHGELTIGDGDHRFVPLAPHVINGSFETVSEELAITPGSCLRLGSIWISIDHESSAWPEFTPQENLPSSTDSLPKSDPEPVTSNPSRRFTPRSLVASIAGTAIVLVVCGLLVFAPDSQPQSIESAEAMRLIHGLGLTGRVTAKSTTDGLLEIAGFVPSKNEYAALQQALNRPDRPLQWQVRVEDDILGKTQASLRASGFPLAVEWTAVGKLKIAGAAPDAEVLATLLAKIRKQTEDAVEIDSDVLLPEQIVANFAKRLQTAQLYESVTLDLRDGKLDVGGRLDAAGLARWESLLIELDRAYGTVLGIHARFPSPMGLLPFIVSQISNGPASFVVTADQKRIFVGGEYMGYKLSAINGRRAVFLGANKVEVEI